MFLPLFCTKNYHHRKPHIYLFGLLSLKHDHIQLAFKKKTFEINDKYYRDYKMESNVFFCMMCIQNYKKVKFLNLQGLRTQTCYRKSGPLD